MGLQFELLKVLSSLPNTQKVTERQALIDFIGFNSLSSQISWEDSNNVFFAGLVRNIASQGQSALLNFLDNLAESPWGKGIERRETLLKLRENIAKLEADKWREEFVSAENSLIDLSESERFLHYGTRKPVIKYPEILLPPDWKQMSTKEQNRWIAHNFIYGLPKSLRTLLVWCSFSNWFNPELLKELILDLHPAIIFTDELWISLKDLPIIQKSPELFDNSYQISEPYRQQLKEYAPTKVKKYRIYCTLSEGFANCIAKETTPHDIAIYKIEQIINSIKSSPVNNLKISSEVLDIYKYEPRLRQRLIKGISPAIQDKSTRWFYSLLLIIANFKNPLLTFLIPRLIENLANSFFLTPRFSLPLLYLSSLFYQTWSHNEDAIRAIRLALERKPETGSPVEGKLRSRLALSLIFIGRMDEAYIHIQVASQIFDTNTEDWIENELNRQIWYLKVGYWQQSLELGKSLESLIRNNLQKAKHTHILGVTYLHFGEVEKANEYAERSLELSSELEGFARLTAWLIGKEWRKRFAYALLANLKVARSIRQDSNRAEQHYRDALKHAQRAVKQAPAILAYTARPLLTYLEASIVAFKQDFEEANHKHSELQKNLYLEEYYRITSQMDLAELYLRLNKTQEGIEQYRKVLEKATISGFKYLELRALRRLHDLNVVAREPKLFSKMGQLTEHQPKLGSNYVDSLEFMLPM